MACSTGGMMLNVGNKRRMMFILLAAALLQAGCRDNAAANNTTDEWIPENTAENAADSGNPAGNASASTWAGQGSRIVEENAVTYRIDPDGTRVRLGENEGRILVERGVRYRVDPSGTRVRIDETGIDIDDPVDLDVPGGTQRPDGVTGEGNSTTGTAGAQPPARISALCRSADLPDAACRSLNNQFQNLEDGVGTLNAPTSMYVDQSYTVALTIGREEDEAQVLDAARAEAGPESTSDVGDVQLAQRMRVELSGSAFRVKPEGEAERELGLSRQATWRWQVTPTAEGANSLVATVVPIAVLGEGRRLELDPARRVLAVQVSVTPEQRLGAVERLFKSTTAVVVALAALIAAISLLVWRARSFGRRPE